MEASTARQRMIAGLGATVRMCDVNGTATSVLEAGHGAPLILLHGGIECGGAMWAPVVARLAREHRVIVPDVPGLGESAPVDHLDLDTFTGWFAGLLEQTGTDRPTLVAHSLMGGYAARLAAGAGDLLGKLIVYAAPAVGPYRTPLRLRYVAIRLAIRPTARNAERFDRFALHDLDATRRRDPAWFEAFQAYTLARGKVPHTKRAMKQLLGQGTRPIPEADLARITVPTELLWGRHDRMVPLAVAEPVAAQHGWPLHVIDDVGHAPHIERPDAFLDALGTVRKPGRSATSPPRNSS